MTKVLFIGDSHIKEENVKDVIAYIDEILQHIDATNPDFVVLLGDILHDHERLHTIALNMALQLIEKISIKKLVFVLVGNHDMTNAKNFLSPNHWMNCLKHMKNVVIVDTPVPYTDPQDGTFFVFCPYVEPGRFVEALEHVPNWKESSCIAAHQEFRGCRQGSVQSIHGDIWDPTWPYVISGHIHVPQYLPPNIYYTGSSSQDSFGENDNPTITLATILPSKANIDMEHIAMKLTKKKILYTNSRDVHELSLPDEVDHLKISVSGSIEEFKQFKKSKRYKELVDNGAKVIFKAKRVEVTEHNSAIEGTLDKDLDFKEILHAMVYEHKNPHIVQVYEKVINCRDVGIDDIMFL